MLWMIAVILAIFCGYWLLKRPHTYWLKRGVRLGSPKIIFGDNFKTFFQRQSFTELVKQIYNSGHNDRFVGCYQCYTPTLVLRDADLIKQIAVKDFDYFMDHRPFTPKNADPLWTRNLLALCGKDWKEMRVTLSPSFTSSKMKFMFSLMSKSGKQLVDYFLNQNQDLIELEMKDTATRFANDVIANTAFGVEVDSLENRTNEFYLMGKELTDLNSFSIIVKFFSNLFFPIIYKFIRFTFFPKTVSNFFTNIIKSNILSRQTHKIVRPDMIHLLLEARKHGAKDEETQSVKETGFAIAEESYIGKIGKSLKVEITDTDIIAQALLFFFAGFDSVSNLLCWTSYELALHPDIQDRLIEEVDETFKRCNEDLTYDALIDMKYMDMVISESLRKWPNFSISDRMCTKPYTIQPNNSKETPLHINVGDILWIPIYSIQRDPKYWSEPEKFDPERFSDENKKKIIPYSYIPFGTGPRNCIGSRLALMEAKILFYYILKNFQIIPVEKTAIPIHLCVKQVAVTAPNFWLGLKRRN